MKGESLKHTWPSAANYHRWQRKLTWDSGTTVWFCVRLNPRGTCYYCSELLVVGNYLFSFLWVLAGATLAAAPCPPRWSSIRVQPGKQSARWPEIAAWNCGLFRLEQYSNHSYLCFLCCLPGPALLMWYQQHLPQPQDWVESWKPRINSETKWSRIYMYIYI